MQNNYVSGNGRNYPHGVSLRQYNHIFGKVMGVGVQLAALRKARSMSQFSLATAADISARHLSFVETGRSQASRGMLLRLASVMNLSHRETNRLLAGAGYQPVFSETALDQHAMTPVSQALDIMLSNHDPLPAVVMDAGWNVLRMNQSHQRLLARMMALRGPFPATRNVMELLFHPGAVRPFVANWTDVASHMLRLLHRDALVRPEGGEGALLEKLLTFPDPPPAWRDFDAAGYVAPMLTVRLSVADATLTLFSTLASFGTALDVAMEELRIEHYFPADDATRVWLKSQAESSV